MSHPIRWALMWHNNVQWHDCLPLLFHTRNEARQWAEKEFGYIKTRKDLRQPPLNWRMPKPVMVQVKLEVL